MIVERSLWEREARGAAPRFPTYGQLAQLVRASLLHSEGRRFESVIVHAPL